MDLNTIVDHEQLFKLELVHPVDEKKLGIVFMIRSANSAEARATARKHADANLARTQRRKRVKVAAVERQLTEATAACIASWDWGEHTWNGEKPEFSVEKAVEILDRAEWIFSQVNEAANAIENFTPSSKKPSQPPSKPTPATT